ncbi:MAG: hypothetical protein MUC87_10100 [Bacteroidia bacterium]|jgi:hypothetical protein|nr:hypothetical protein [Bacteroidia bacterium]
MRALVLILLMLLSVICRAQTGAGKTLVIKVRAPKESCTIYADNNFFWLEKNNVVRIKTRGVSEDIQVVLSGGRIIAREGESYTLFFTQKNIAVITVYKRGAYGREVLLAKQYEVRGPVLWFCGIKTDSSSRVLKLKGANLYAWSDYFKQAMPVRSFDMVFMEDTNRRVKAKKKPELFHSDSCMLTGEMTNKVLHYQPKYNYIYFYNIVCEVPDGTKRLLDPIRLHAVVDTTNKEKLSMWYSVYRKTD